MRELAAQVSQAMTEEFPKLGLELKVCRYLPGLPGGSLPRPYKDHFVSCTDCP